MVFMTRLWLGPSVRMSRQVVLASVVAGFSALPATVRAQTDPVASRLRERVAALQAGSSVVHGTPVAARAILTVFYTSRGFTPAWTDVTGRQLGEAIAASAEDGLRPADYHTAILTRLDSLIDEAPTPELMADRDLLRSDAWLRLAYHLRYGKIEQKALEPAWVRGAKLGDSSAVLALSLATDSAEVLPVLEAQRPQHPAYIGLRAALFNYRQLAAAGGWQDIPKGPPLKPGMVDGRVPALRQRLILTGDYAGGADTSSVLDSLTVRGLRHYQHRHGLEEDGAMGEGTRRSLNVPVSRRIDQIRVNLDRARLDLRNLDSVYLDVNLPQFQVTEFDHGVPIWISKVQVGQRDRKTPLFRTKMAAVVLNPTWTVPPTILSVDVIPGMRKSAKYLEKKGIDVYDKKGNPVDPTTIDWHTAGQDSFPYVLRQDAGDDNALGKVKFLIPNPWAIFMHDTPHRAAFKQSSRATSSGCIRVQLPMELARIALGRNDSTWTPERIDSSLADGKTKTVALKNGLPVRIEYRTAAVERDGLVYLLPDVYDRDARSIKVLNTPFGETLPPMPPDAPPKPG